MSIFLALAIFALAVVLQALFAGYEAGFISANLYRVRHLAEEEGRPRAARLLAHIQRPDRMLASLLIGTNLAVIIGAIALTHQAENYFSTLQNIAPKDVRLIAQLTATLVAAPILLVFAEIIPKSVFRTHPTRLSLALLPVIEFFGALMAPLSIPICWITGALLRSVGGKQDYISPIMTSLEDVRLLVDEGADHGTIEPEEQEMIHSVIDLQSTLAKEIMVPRIDVQALPDTATRAELVALFEESGRTRIPIYHGTVDTIVGITNAYDILMDVEPEREDIERFVKDVIHVPDTMRVDDLFSTLKGSKQHLAIVTNEYGGTDGLVTMEDIFEEIFGEIQDEYDSEQDAIRQVGPNTYVMEARVELEEVAEAIKLPMADEEVETIGGWVMHVAGRIPAKGEVVQRGRFRVTVLEGSPNQLATIRLDILDEKERIDEKEEERE